MSVQSKVILDTSHCRTRARFHFLIAAVCPHQISVLERRPAKGAAIFFKVYEIQDQRNLHGDDFSAPSPF